VVSSRDFVAQLCLTRKLPYATAQAATATNRVTNMTSVYSVDDVLASSLVLVSSIANLKRNINLRACKRENICCKRGKVVQRPCLFYAICCNCNMRSCTQRFCHA